MPNYSIMCARPVNQNQFTAEPHPTRFLQALGNELPWHIGKTWEREAIAPPHMMSTTIPDDLLSHLSTWHHV